MLHELPFSRNEALSLPKEKILAFPQAVTAIRKARQNGLQVVLVQGTYDLTHMRGEDYRAHIRQLHAAKGAADLLFVGLERDETVALNRANREPHMPLDDRLHQIAARTEVDFVFGFEDIITYGENNEEYIKRYKLLHPDLLAIYKSGTHIDTKIKQATQAGVRVVLIDEEGFHHSS